MNDPESSSNGKKGGREEKGKDTRRRRRRSRREITSSSFVLIIKIMKTGQDIKKLGKKVKREKETPEKLEIKSKINEMLKIGEKRFKFQT